MDNCRLCGRQSLFMLLELGEHPIAHNFLNSPTQQKYVHPVTLCFCDRCGLIQLINPISPEFLYTNYVCLSSWKYQPHISRLMQMIEEFTGLEKTASIFEVGSNDGIFLTALAERGYKNLVGVEPARDAQEAAQQKGVKTIPGYFNQKTAEEYATTHGKCNLFISRQMLEHIDDLRTFREAMQTVLSPGSFVVFEVPDFTCNLDAFDYAVWEEHVNYFTLQTLKHFLSYAGIRIVHSETAVFSGVALMIIGEYIGDSLSLEPPGYIKELQSKVLRYRDQWPAFRNAFIEYLQRYKEKGGKSAAYGAGARLCSLINFIGLEPYLEFIVDDQPEKQGKYMPGSKLPILSSDALKKNAIDLCLLAVNAECEEKIVAMHADFQTKGGTFISVLPPSDRLPDFWKQFLSMEKQGAAKGYA